MIVITLRWFYFIYFVEKPPPPSPPLRQRPEEEGMDAWWIHLNDELQVNVRTLETLLVLGGWGGGGRGVFWECVSVVISYACLPVYHSVWFVGSHRCPRLPHPPKPQPNPPLSTGLSSNVPQDSVSPAVFKIQFRCTIQICFGEQRGRQTHYVGKKMDTHHLMVLWLVVGRGTPKRSNAITAEAPWQTVRFFFLYDLSCKICSLRTQETTHGTSDGSRVISPAINIFEAFQLIRSL